MDCGFRFMKSPDTQKVEILSNGPHSTPRTDFQRIVTNAGWNLTGNVLPLGAAVFAMPFLVAHLGTSRFGLLSLGWIMIGYFSLFDFGLGRALTKMVAERSDSNADGTLSALCSTGMALVGALGLAGGLLVAAAIPWGSAWLGSLPEELRGEARQTLVLISLGIPMVVITSALRGILEGFQRFRLLSAIRVPTGVALFLAPCATAAFSSRLDLAIGSLLVVRLVVVVAHAWPCMRLVRLGPARIQRAWIGPLLHFGGWLTVSNVIGPLIVYVDRFAIGGMLSAAALAYYSAPFEVVSRLLLFPLALTTALFPELSRSKGRDPATARSLRRRSLKLTFAVVTPLSIVGALIAEPALRVWLGAEFASQGANVMRILLVGFVFNAAAQVPFAALQSYGRTRQTALLHVLELPIYLALLISLVRAYGLDGAAAAWAMRALFDWVALSWLLISSERHEASTVTPNDHAKLHLET
jgi:O-antigen/teichoic acid export membrane protein